LKDAQKELQNSVNQYKKKSKEKIDNAKKILDVGEANLELIKRIEEIQKISEGVTKRTEKLIEEKRRIEKIFSITYKRLFLFLEETQANITKKRLEEIADEICGGKINLFNGLKSIKVMPYLKRVNSYEIRRLEKLEIYLKNNKEDMFLRAIENAIKKMRPIIKEINQRKKIKTGSLF
jgi:exonuclease VII large subunit